MDMYWRAIELLLSFLLGFGLLLSLIHGFASSVIRLMSIYCGFRRELITVWLRCWKRLFL
jgi:hypothetical protein